MATAPQFDPYGEPREKQARPWLVTCLVGCLVIVVVVVIVAAVIAYWISQNWRDWASAAGSQGIMQSVNASDLPPQEKQEIEVQVDRVADAFSEGRLSMEQVGTIVEKLMQSPVLTTIVASTADTKYLNQSGLSDEEKAEGRITLQRFVRGVIDGEIDERSAEAALTHIGDRQGDGTLRLRNQVSDEQLRAFFAAAKAEADEAEVPEEPEPFDPSDEVKRIIDEAMNEPVEEVVN